jgi:Glutamine phosphoribosylpyrophosphate amidotransferase
MCGLTGALSDWLTGPETEVFRHLFFMSTLRGSDGCGLVNVPQKKAKEIKVFRSTELASTIAYSQAYADMEKHAKNHTSLWMGHSRATTRGSNDLGDCHPHTCGHIVGMHNGTLTEVDGKKVDKDQSDSQLLFKSIAEKGIDEAIKGVKGSYALVWLDRTKSQINFLRNEQRDLYFAYIEGKQTTLWWCSEKEMLQYSFERVLDEKLALAQLKPNTLITYSIYPPGGKLRAASYRQLEKPTSVPVVPIPAQQLNEAVQRALNVPLPDVELPEDKEHVHMMTFAGQTVTLSELQDVLYHGCVICDKPQSMTDYGRLIWTNRTEFVCEFCYKNDGFAQQYANASINAGNIKRGQ